MGGATRVGVARDMRRGAKLCVRYRAAHLAACAISLHNVLAAVFFFFFFAHLSLYLVGNGRKRRMNFLPMMNYCGNNKASAWRGVIAAWRRRALTLANSGRAAIWRISVDEMTWRTARRQWHGGGINNGVIWQIRRGIFRHALARLGHIVIASRDYSWWYRTRDWANARVALTAHGTRINAHRLLRISSANVALTNGTWLSVATLRAFDQSGT